MKVNQKKQCEADPFEAVEVAAGATHSLHVTYSIEKVQ